MNFGAKIYKEVNWMYKTMENCLGGADIVGISYAKNRLTSYNN